MIYLELFLGFLRVGLFSFGGAYAAIPLIRDVVLSYGWLTDDSLSYMIAVSESTPGPIMVNLATYVGSNQAGFWGAAVATTAVVFPSYMIILLVTVLLKSLLKNRYVQAVLRGFKPSIVGIILAVGLYMTGEQLIASEATFNFKAAVIALVLGVAMITSQKLLKKPLSPILLILLGAGLGILVY